LASPVRVLRMLARCCGIRREAPANGLAMLVK
jgi:hypothetical protein